MLAAVPPYTNPKISWTSGQRVSRQAKFPQSGKSKAEFRIMRSSKSRSRSKNNRNRNNSLGNVVNRVFDSSGPEGKVRGTPQQIIDKYNQLARDATLSNDRVAAENFQQHAEHYLRMLSEAQREQDARREQQEKENRERQAQRDRERAERDAQRAKSGQQGGGKPETDGGDDQPSADQQDVLEFDTADEGDSGLVETPENAAPKADAADADTAAKPAKKPSKPRTPRKTSAKKSADADGAEKPKPTRSRKPKSSDAGETVAETPSADAAPDAAE